jgi:Fe2+ transport system protein FeoA
VLPRSGVAVIGKGAMSLIGARRNDRVRVLRVSGRPLVIQRLAALGVVPGVVLTVLKPKGPMVVSMGGARIAIGAAAAESVEIEVA